MFRYKYAKKHEILETNIVQDTNVEFSISNNKIDPKNIL